MPQELLDVLKNPWFYFISVIIVFLSYKILPLLIQSFENRRLEVFKRELLRREKAEVIAELLVLLGRKQLSDSEKDAVDKILYQLCLALPPCLIHKMSHTVCKSGEAEDVGPYGLLVCIKDFIEGRYAVDKKRKLTPDNIPHTSRNAEQGAGPNERERGQMS
jgi:hypothetical protein